MEDQIELTNLKEVLDKYCEDFKALYKLKLKQDNWVASGNLLRSVEVNYTLEDKKISVNVSLLDYYKYVENGRGKTTTTSSDNIPLYYKIKTWMEDKGIHPQNRGLKYPSKNLDSASYAIARSIHKQGWKKVGTHPLEKTLEGLSYIYSQYLGEALTQDITNSLSKELLKGLSR